MSFLSKRWNKKPKKDQKPNVETPKYNPEKVPKNKIKLSKFDPKQKSKNREVSVNNEVKTLQKLFNDGEKKECGRCHQIKPKNEYGARMTGGKKTLFSRCKDCRLESNQIYQYNNKLKIVQNIYNGKLKGKCQTCNTDVNKLPSLEFHHNDPKLKKVKGISMYRNWEKTKQQIENEKATILCVNCHTIQRSKHYNKHKKIIQEDYFGPDTTNEHISQYVKNKLPNTNHEERRQVMRHIKKKIVINHLYGGKCVGCGDVNTKDNLPALQFHHRDKKNPYNVSKTYVNLRNLEIKEIIKKLKQENCVLLCENCHRMDQSPHFKNNYKQIVKAEHWNQIKEDYEMIEKNLGKFKFKEEEN